METSRRCSNCRKEKPAHEFYFCATNSKGYLGAYCIECHRKRNIAALRARKRLAQARDIQRRLKEEHG